MKTIIFTSILMLVCSLASAQVVIDDPVYGSVIYTELVAEGHTDIRDAGTSVEENTIAIGMRTFSTTLPDFPTYNFLGIKNVKGALEFSLADVPESITSNNFTAKLIGIQGQPTSASVSLSVDLYDMTDDQENMVIDEDDYDLDTDAVSINGDPFINGEFEDGTIDVTEQLRADLFGEGADRVSSGFILMASGEADMTGIVEFPEIANAYIQLNLIDSDTDSGDDTDSATENQDTDTTPQVTDTSSDTTTQPQDTSSDTGTTGDTESEYWDTVDGSDDGPGAESSGEGNVKCNCSTAGAHSIGASILNLLF
jgi:hypothetical protein